VKKVLGRLALVFLGLICMALLGSAGLIPGLTSHPVGLTLYWAVFLGIFGLLVFGVLIPVYRYLQTRDSFFARLMTNRLGSKGR